MLRKVQRRLKFGWAMGLVVGSSMVLAACGGTSGSPNASPRPGVITGIADMCSGAPGAPPHNVQVRLLDGKRLIAHQTYFGNHIFRFSVPAGRYTVTSDQSYATPVQVAVQSGEAVHIEVYSTCS
jgi:hypothetical protein